MNAINVPGYRCYEKTEYDSGRFPYMLPTEDDLPYDDGDVMETERHKEQMNLLIDSLKAFWKDSRKYYTGGNMFIHFEADSTKHFKGPDFFLVTDTDSRERKSWVVWQENMRFPDVIIELLSDSTRETDKKDKKKLYSQIFGTPEYYIYDPFSYEFRGYRLSGHSYKTVKPDREKKIYSQITGLYLAVRNDRLRWMTRDGYILPSHEELSETERKRAESEKHRAEAEKQKAEQAEKKAEKERLRAESEKQKAEQERLRAESEKHKAEKERLRAEQAEQRAAMLADKLRQLGIAVE